ncbi:MAG: hypothetical protein M1829_005306 [Trizodia sp. TS-e1964]|nr:MAG: hypothetical protein M1829_005306 [Trizodia sp. TS-e1964]
MQQAFANRLTKELFDLGRLITVDNGWTIKWGITAWQQDVTAETIEKCWIKSRVLSAKIGLENLNLSSQVISVHDDNLVDINPMVIKAIGISLQHLESAGIIKSAMSILRLIEPVEEIIIDDNNDIEEDIIARYTTLPESESEEESEILPKISAKEALRGLEITQQFLEQQSTQAQKIQEAAQQISHLKKLIYELKMDSLHQSLISDYFTR